MVGSGVAAGWAGVAAGWAGVASGWAGVAAEWVGIAAGLQIFFSFQAADCFGPSSCAADPPSS